MNISKLLKLMEKAKLSKVRLGEMAGVSDVTISNILKGSDAKISSIKSIANALSVPVGYFFDEEPIAPGNLASVKGNNNVLVGGSNLGTINKLSECEREVELLTMQVKHLTAQVEEKERLIQVLMKN